MTTRLLLLAPLPLVGCLSSLWVAGREEVEITARGAATMVVEAIGVAPGEPGPELLLVIDPDAIAVDAENAEAQLAVQVGPAAGGTVTSPWARDPVQSLYLLALEDKGGARALVDLLTGEPLGPIDHCAIELDWTLHPHQSASWGGRIAVRGTFSPALRECALDADTARTLLASAAALPVDTTEDPELQRCAAEAATIDWRTLRPLMANGTGRALAFLPRAGAPMDCATLAELDLVVSVGSAEEPRFLRVPAAAVSTLAAVRHDPSTLCPRFAFTGRCRPRPPRALDLALQPLRCRGEVQLVTRIEVEGHHYGWFTRNVLIPVTEAIDAVAEFVWRLLGGQPWRPPASPQPKRRR